MTKSLALLGYGVVVLASSRRLEAQTTNIAGDVELRSQTAALGGIQHIVWVWFENREYTAITAVTAPYFTSFAAANVNLTNFYGVSHPSQPNYLDGFSGSNQGVTNDSYCASISIRRNARAHRTQLLWEHTSTGSLQPNARIVPRRVAS
jgi:hypothetical protein